jgi:hypothetical protein
MSKARGFAKRFFLGVCALFLMAQAKPDPVLLAHQCHRKCENESQACRASCGFDKQCIVACSHRAKECHASCH